MKVILLQKIHQIGDVGSVVKVKAGYGRNYLLPQNKAIRATKENIESFEMRRIEFEKKAAETLAIAQERAEKLKDLKVIITRRALETGKLFGSVGVRDIVNAIEEKGLEVERQEISLSYGIIRDVGEYDAQLRLYGDVIVPIKIIVEPE